MNPPTTLSTRKVLRAVADSKSNSGFTIERVEVCDACCGSNVAMLSDSEHLHATLAQQLSVATMDLSRLFVPQSVPLSLSTSLLSAGLSSSSPRRIAHPRTSAGSLELNALGSEAYQRRQEFIQVLEDIKQHAAEAKQSLVLEYEKKLQEQGLYWRRRVEQLEGELACLHHSFAQQQQQRDVLSSLCSLRGDSVRENSINEMFVTRNCGGPVPPGRRAGRGRHCSNLHRPHPAETLKRELASSTDDLLPQRVTEALLHILQKQPVVSRRSKEAFGSSQRFDSKR
jgi:hypothetical protein